MPFAICHLLFEQLSLLAPAPASIRLLHMHTRDPDVPDPAALSALGGKKGCSVTTSGVIVTVIVLACAVWALASRSRAPAAAVKNDAGIAAGRERAPSLPPLDAPWRESERAARPSADDPARDFAARIEELMNRIDARDRVHDVRDIWAGDEPKAATAPFPRRDPSHEWRVGDYRVRMYFHGERVATTAAAESPR